MYGFKEFDLWWAEGRLELRSISGRPADYHGSAACNRHLAPELDCSCGYYAYSKPDRWSYTTKGDHVLRAYLPAKVWGHGRLIEHHEGFRAELLRILYFIVPKCMCNQRLQLYAGPALYTGPIFAQLGCPRHYENRKRLPDPALEKLADEYGAGIVMGEPLKATSETWHNTVS